MIGVLITLLSATTFGINHAMIRRGVISGTATQAVAISMPVGLAFFTIVALLMGQLGVIAQFSPFALLMLAAAGIAHFVFGRYCAYRAIAAMGVNLATPATQWSLLVSLVLAMSFLGEKLDAIKLAGIGLIVLGPALLAARYSRRKAAPDAAATATTAAASPTFKPRLVEGYTFAFLACFGWGSSPVLVRAGLEGPGQALAGGVVSYAAATVVVALLMLISGPRRDLASMSARNLRWFSGTSMMTAVSQMLLYFAMAIAPVIVVQPLLRFQTLASTIAGWYLNRQHESFDRGVLWAIGVSMIGAVLLALDGQTLMRVLDLPTWLAPVFTWRWPG
jgi:drug/metabolite transporter (DMT)-like permease